jgi:hypothetical protein
MNRDYKKGSILLIALIGIIIIIALNFIVVQRISFQKEKLESFSYTDTTKKKVSNIQYSNIIKDIEKREYIKIERIVNNMDSNIVNINLKFKGTLYLLEIFIEDIKNKDNFYSVSSIKLKRENNETYIGELSINFIDGY